MSSARACSTSIPPGLTDELIETVLGTGVPYFDLSLQHVSRPLLAGMRRWGDGDRFLRRIGDIRAADARRHLPLLLHPRLPGRDRARPRSPARVPRRGAARLGRLLPVLARGRAPTPPASTDQVPAELALERLRECAELQDAITAAKRDALIGATRQVLVDAPGRGRTVHEAPEIDGIVHLPDDLAVGQPRRRHHHRRGGARPVRRAAVDRDRGPGRRRGGSGTP